MQNALFNLLIIRYGEIGLKSTKVRGRLERILSKRIRQMLGRKKIPYESLINFPTRGRLFLYTADLQKAIEELQKCFGIVSISPAFQISSDREEIRGAALRLAQDTIKMKETFAIRTKRTGEHPFSSQEISAEIGALLLERLGDRPISVNLTHPDHTIYIEIRDKQAFLFNQMIKGVAGLPYGSQGRLVSLISGGIDSPVATWFMMKRGCDIIPLFCDLTPYTNESSYTRLIAVLHKLFEYSPYEEIPLYVAPHGQTLERIKEFIPPKLTCLFCKRIMYQLAEKLAAQVNAKGIVTGENLGQVASQTLDNLFVLNQAIRIPIFQPLIGFDKTETIALSNKLGFYSSSIMPVPSCGAVPQYPETHGTLEAILELEKKYNIDKLVEEEFQNIKKVNLPLSQ